MDIDLRPIKIVFDSVSYILQNGNDMIPNPRVQQVTTV